MRRGAALALALGIALAGCRGAPDDAPAWSPPELDTQGFHPQLAHALEQAARDVAAAPDSAAAWGRYGMLFHAHRLPVEAGKCYERAMQLDPADFRWPYLLATRHDFGRLEPEARLGLLLRARALNPYYAPLNVRIGDLLLQLDRTGEAGPYYEAARLADPECSQALLGLGRVALAAGDAERARDWLEEARWQDRRQREVYTLLARVYDELDRPDLARRAEELAARVPGSELDDPVLDQIERYSFGEEQLRERAEAQIRRGDYEGAIQTLRALLEAAPDDDGTRARLAQLLESTGRHGEARALLE